MHKIAKHQKKRNLVSIYRDEIDELAIQGFILAASEELILIQYVYDFQLDGLMVLRIRDISEVRCSATDIFQKALLKAEGLLKKVPFEIVVDLQNWRSVINQFSKQYPLMILECETREQKEFMLGRVLKTTVSGVQIKCFTGVANWEETPVKLKFQDITSCRLETNYVNVYQRYFERQSSLL